MKPRVQAHMVKILGRWNEGPPHVVQFGWDVFYARSDGRLAKQHFWLWPAAVDFAIQQVAEACHKNHVHLW